MVFTKLAKRIAACGLFVTMLSVARAETDHDWLCRVVGAYSDYGSPATTPTMWEERAKTQFPELNDPSSAMQRFIVAERAALQKSGSDVLKKPEASYELAVLTGILLRGKSIPIDKADFVASQFVANIAKFDDLFVSAQKQISQNSGTQRTLTTTTQDGSSRTITVTQPQQLAAPQDARKIRTLAEWITYIKSDAKFSSLQALLGKPDGKEESQDNIQRYTTYRWWSKIDVGTTHPEDLKVITVIAHGQPIIVRLVNPSSGEEMDFPWTDATIWAQN